MGFYSDMATIKLSPFRPCADRKGYPWDWATPGAGAGYPLRLPLGLFLGYTNMKLTCPQGVPQNVFCT